MPASVVNPTDYRVSWSALKDIMDWQQDEHVTLVGPTGAGKTTFTNAIIPEQPYNIFLGTKRVDETQDKLQRMGFHTVSDPDVIHRDIARDWVVRPPFPANAKDASGMIPVHRDVFRRTFMRAYNDTGWTVYVDEARYIYGKLGLADEGVLLYMQGRSQGNAVVTSTQRPRHIPLEAYDMATHLVFFKDRDILNVRRVAEMAGMNPRRVVELVKSLRNRPKSPHPEDHEFLYVNSNDNVMAISHVEKEGD